MENGCSVVVLGNGCDGVSLCAALEAKGIKAGMVNTLDKAAVLAQTEGVRLVIVDEAFYDSASAGWQLRQRRMIPVALYGGNPDGVGWKKAFDLEADVYLAKSMSLAEQVARVKAVLRGYRVT